MNPIQNFVQKKNEHILQHITVSASHRKNQTPSFCQKLQKP